MRKSRIMQALILRSNFEASTMAHSVFVVVENGVII